MTRILLIGKDGQVGQELLKTLAPLGSVQAVGRSELDLSQADLIQSLIQQAQPQIIVNAAAYTAVDKAESEPELAMAINGDAPTVMATAAQAIGATLIHISTDYVFNGQHYLPYTETDPTDPVSAYGRSKLAGEVGIQQAAAEMPFPHAILRTAWVYGAQGKGNFVKTMLRLGADREEVRVVADQIGTPTAAAEIARAIAGLAPQIQAGSSDSGIYHFTNSGVASWYDFAVAIFEEAKSIGFPLKINRVVPISTAEFPTPTQRPAYSVLACQKITACLQTPAPQWRQSLRQMLTDLYTQTHESNYSLRR